MHFKDLQHSLDGILLQLAEDRLIQNLLIDSRKAVIRQESLFFAIKGDRHDGHVFLKELYQLGVRQFIVEQDLDIASFKGANILKVKSSVAALQTLAALHRNSFQIPIVGITGSNGKTIVKEWLFHVLSTDLQIVKNPGSYNSQVGVPISVWQIQKNHELGIFEAGISRPGEMVNLEKIIHPTIGVFTNLGSAHDEGFSSREEKATEKAKLFIHCERVIYCRDHSLIHDTLHKAKTSTLSWGFSKEADIQIIRSDIENFDVSFKSQKFKLSLPFRDAASQENAFHVMAFMLLRNYSPADIQERIMLLQSVPMRLELKQGINRCTLIDDSYNNDLAGLQISLDYLKNQQKMKKTLILSDVLQSGLPVSELIKDIKELIADGQVKKFIGIGPTLFAHQSSFESGDFFPSTSAFLEKFNSDSFADEVVLIKGARSFQFEKIAQRLQRKVHGTVMEVDMNAMIHNLNYFKSKLNPGTKLMAMVKAFAYGSGSEEVANMLQYHRIDYLGVAYPDEGIELRKNNISLPIMIMNPSEESFGLLLEYHLEPEVYNLKLLRSLIAFLNGKECSIHLKLDTGMHRLGFEEDQLDDALDIIKQNKNIRIASVFSHLSGADEQEHDNFSSQQATSFIRMAEKTEKQIGYRPIRHLLNSPGIIRLPQYQFDMVRLGIGLYGVDPTEDGHADLKPVASIKTVISQIKNIKAGETIGYGRRGKAEKNLTLATIAIGYADGYSRNFSRGKGKVLIDGKLAPVIGNVCMDMTMVDITGINVKEGDEAIIFGPGLPIHQVAKWIDTIPYEILTNTSERVKRVFYAESI
ncbi:MAG: bifunctional UDP-N-acetylmuramoyl-tripeptide:D-alanyl-D-alanine ligase/alanine racemase [Cyclobacteriaceae bacterium]|nr:bifunctional UDP-N-acetylmuramoyl-tripeptide:D-alanyl-D-alanine ligase/alanine racemase [Cyclobacteriaceae bacterium]